MGAGEGHEACDDDDEDGGGGGSVSPQPCNMAGAGMSDYIHVYI